MAKWVIALAVACALSRVDLIPDFIPVPGYLDDLILLPAGIWIAVRLVPEEVWRENQAIAAGQPVELRGRIGHCGDMGVDGLVGDSVDRQAPMALSNARRSIDEYRRSR